MYLSPKAKCKIVSLNCIDKLLVTTGISMSCIYVVFPKTANMHMFLIVSYVFVSPNLQKINKLEIFFFF